ncbi:MAG: hypothetical protein M3Z21_17195 [Pseudomonadota bacterium]|nr:hypothetical protein [Pseudomonadota bacterium]
MPLVLLETSANQAYLFATNRLRENVGASELTYRAGTEFVLEAVKDAGGPDLWSDDPQTLRDNLLNNPRKGDFEVILATSGKALLRVPDDEAGKKIVAAATLRALQEAPGLDLCGVVSGDFAWDKVCIHDQIKALHKNFEAVRSDRIAPAARFPMLPVCAPCSSSGLPAEMLDDLEQKPLSWMSKVKRDTGRDWPKRIKSILKHHQKSFQLPKNPEELDQIEERSWLAVVHADGNGLGQIFLNFDVQAECKNAGDNDKYVDKLRRFSAALEEATETAFCQALEVLEPEKNGNWLPVVPLVLGGDDLTVICDGRKALDFTCEFLRRFEEQTGKENSIIREIAKGRLSACAGVAIVKPHFPFHTAYELAEALLKSAKQVKKEVEHVDGLCRCSALDFHILYDASCTGLDDIRRRLKAKDDVLTAKPYVVTPMERLDATAGEEWAKAHDVEALRERVGVLRKQDESGRQLLASSQMHALRETLHRGRTAADAHIKAMRHRYKDQGFDKLLEDPSGDGSLFRSTDKGGETRFLDALDSAEFWRECKNDEQRANADD